jgi:hypothetical protein
MSYTSSELSVFQPTTEVIQILVNPALVGSENIDDYDRPFCVNCFSNQADRSHRLDIGKGRRGLDLGDAARADHQGCVVKHYQKESSQNSSRTLASPGQLGPATYRTFQADSDLTTWAIDPKGRAASDAALAA